MSELPSWLQPLVQHVTPKAPVIREPGDLYDYERRAVDHQCTHEQSAMWMDMGLGKTVVTLTAIQHLLYHRYLTGVLVVAPLRVVRLVWRQEAKKWTHTSGLTFSVVAGTRDQRIRALMVKADIYLLNYENLKWLAELLEHYFLRRGKYPPFDGIVWDEISKMKNSASVRAQSFAKIMPYIKWRTGLTGTPSSNGYKDLHGQYLMLDDGVRLGTSKTQFTQRFFYKASQYKEVPFDETKDQIQQLIGDITLQMSAEDYNPLPDLIMNDITLELPPELRQKYDALENEYFFQLDNGTQVEVFNAASMTNKCLQFANGAVYLDPITKEWDVVHDMKLDALEDIIEEAGGQQLLCGYGYVSDATRIMERFKRLRPINLTKCKSETALNNAMSRWANGDCPLMIGHPASMGHGIDRLQEAGHLLAWYGTTWSLDLFDQFNARIRRQGQGAPVICNRILMQDTLDYAQIDALESKAASQTELRKAVGRYRRTRGL